MCTYIGRRSFFIMMKRWKIWELALLFSLCLSSLTGTWCASRQEALAHKLIRLHVLAQSDSAADQQAKLRARDAVLELLGPALEGAESRSEAVAVIREIAPILVQRARLAAGAESAALELGRERYPLREYGDFALPAGEYLSLRISLGEGEGRNWWCVVYPPLCTSSAESAAAFDEEDWRLISEDGTSYEIRFRLLELWGELTEGFPS